jgi:hypothetical protein
VPPANPPQRYVAPVLCPSWIYQNRNSLIPRRSDTVACHAARNALRAKFHGGGTATEAVRRALQLRQASLRALARRHGASPAIVQKWPKRSTTADARTGAWGPAARAPSRPRRRRSPPPCPSHPAAAAGRWPVPPSARRPAPGPPQPAPLPGAARDRPLARTRGCRPREEADLYPGTEPAVLPTTACSVGPTWFLASSRRQAVQRSKTTAAPRSGSPAAAEPRDSSARAP